MSEKKYDLSRVSQATKDAYLQAVIDFDCKGGIKHSVLREASHALYQEAEVTPKTAREILEEAYNSESRAISTTVYHDGVSLLEAIRKALELLP